MCIRDRYIAARVALLEEHGQMQRALRAGKLYEDVVRRRRHRLHDDDEDGAEPVSYTHLDVYKRQVWR